VKEQYLFHLRCKDTKYTRNNAYFYVLLVILVYFC
jgi:hypothetical protein